MADRLGVVDLIDREVGRSRSRKASVGTTLLLGALNRAIRPQSKRGWADWAAGTSLHRLFPGLKTETVTSQFFWDQMNRVSLDALRRIEEELTQRIVTQLDLKLDTLFYDTTNFFTYIATTNRKPKLPQRGRSKQKRFDLRLFSLALLVARDGQIPLYAHVYAGNEVDSKRFPESLTDIRERLAKLSIELEDVTLVYDKGNNSKPTRPGSMPARSAMSLHWFRPNMQIFWGFRWRSTARWIRAAYRACRSCVSRRIFGGSGERWFCSSVSSSRPVRSAGWSSILRGVFVNWPSGSRN